jgi:hypothetical protein
MMRLAARALVAAPILAGLAFACSAALDDMPGADNAGPARGSIAEATRSLELRPTSPDAWASMIAARYEAGLTDEAFQLAFVRAAGLGPHEPAVQLVAAFYGLAIWADVAPPARAAIERLVANGVKRDPEALLTIAGRRGRLPLACRHVSPGSQLCTSTEAK